MRACFCRPLWQDDRIITDDEITRLYVSTKPLLTQIARRRFRIPADQAEELVHDIFLSFLRHSEEVADIERWLVGAICHAARAWHRKHDRLQNTPDDYFEQMTFDPALDIGLIVRETLALLRPRDRRAIELRVSDGCTFAEVGRILGVRPKRGERIYRHAIARARRILRA
jgi:RNA polymerase sigma factor (sigma-70 family)